MSKYQDAQIILAHANDTTQKDPFEKTFSYWGACYRVSFGAAPATKIRLLKARFVYGDYDQGGGYWGPGLPIYAAVDSAIPCTYCRYVRAATRAEAAQLLKLSPAQLLRK
jgi:hypothetical protein